MRTLMMLFFVLLAGCSGEIYVRDHVTDGDTFYLAPQALVDDDPALQSWVAYSLMLSACQLDIGGENPARASSYDCELSARQMLVDTWKEQSPGPAVTGDDYLSRLAIVERAGFLEEYTVHYHAGPDWKLPPGLDMPAFLEWKSAELAGHRSQKRIIGSWNYAAKVAR